MSVLYLDAMMFSCSLLADPALGLHSLPGVRLVTWKILAVTWKILAVTLTILAVTLTILAVTLTILAVIIWCFFTAK
jgi:hypothetical protein